MKKDSMCVIICLLFVALLCVIPASTATQSLSLQSSQRQTAISSVLHPQSIQDLDPLVDEIIVTVEITDIRSLERMQRHTRTFKTIDRFTKPDFYVKVFINENEFQSPVWRNQRYLYDLNWVASSVVPKDQEFVFVRIELWDWNPGLNRRMDISRNINSFRDSFAAEMNYSVKTGTWWGDDYPEDPSGYGRLSGTDDRSVYSRENDCELWFNIYQNDYDGDGIPYWAEVYMYGTDPMVDDRGIDYSGDGIPIEWEHKWGIRYNDWRNEYYWVYHPFEYNDHYNLDPDNDGLSNYQEYLMSEWGSDPFRRDIFIDLGQMQAGPNGEQSILPEKSKELITTAFHSQNIVIYFDEGQMGGGQMIPFQESTSYEDLQKIYRDYFLQGDEDNWRRGVFHYGLVVYNASYHGFVFWGGVGPYLDAFQISSKEMERKSRRPWIKRDVAYASAYMHELGHTLAIFNSNTPGCDDQNSKFPWQRNYWIWGRYKSIMNYRYMYYMVDYSDGSRGKNDFNDWCNIDLTFFNTPLWDD
ncbi:MAG: hypothetical protein R6V50_01295 [Thermoplasmatota archaeon]